MKNSRFIICLVCFCLLLGVSSIVVASEGDGPIHRDAVVEYHSFGWESTATGPHPSRYGNVTHPYKRENGSNFTLQIRYVGSVDGADFYHVKYSASRHDKAVIKETEKAVIYRGEEIEIYRDDAVVIKIFAKTKS